MNLYNEFKEMSEWTNRSGITSSVPVLLPLEGSNLFISLPMVYLRFSPAMAPVERLSVLQGEHFLNYLLK